MLAPEFPILTAQFQHAVDASRLPAPYKPRVCACARVCVCVSVPQSSLSGHQTGKWYVHALVGAVIAHQLFTYNDEVIDCLFNIEMGDRLFI